VGLLPFGQVRSGPVPAYDHDVSDQEPRGPVAIHARLSPHRAGRGVWWRYSWLLLTALAALTLTFFSLFRIGLSPSPHVSFRQQTVWQSGETLLIKRAVPTQFRGSMPVMVSLSEFYSRIAESSAVRALVLKGGPLHGRYNVAPVQSGFGSPTSFFRIEGQASSPGGAARIAARVSAALRAYSEQRQAEANIPQAQRVQLGVVAAQRKPTLIQGHWRKGPLIALSVVMGLLLLAASIKFAEERRS
jgi:hypothetical protein